MQTQSRSHFKVMGFCEGGSGSPPDCCLVSSYPIGTYIYMPYSFINILAEGADEPCDPAWFLAGSKCYSVIPIPKTWNEAIVSYFVE